MIQYNKTTNRMRNPRNFRTKLFTALTKLLSGPLINRHQQMPRRLRADQLANRKFNSLSGQEFKHTRFNPLETISLNYFAQQNRLERYSEFEQMEFDALCASVLDLYSDEMTTCSELSELLNIDCSNQEIKTILHELYYDILSIEENLFWWFRSMIKYGDFFLYLDVDEKLGITSVTSLPVIEMERLEGLDKTNPNYLQFQWNAGGMTFENWQVAHFRILGNDKFYPYGMSVLDPARRIFRQINLMEESMLAYRVVRASERRVFYIDVAGVEPENVHAYMEKAVTEFKRATVIDSDSGRSDLRYNPISTEQDYFVPTRGSTSSTKIETLPGGQFTGVIDDVKYLLDKFFGAVKVPQSYLVRGEGGEEDKATLAQKDIRFARTVQRLQRPGISELTKIGIIHLFTLGFRGKDLIDFKLSLNNPSKLATLQDLEHWKMKFEIAGAATEGFFSKRWISQNILKLSNEDYKRVQYEMFTDKNQEAALESSAAKNMTDNLGNLGGEFEDSPLGPNGPDSIKDIMNGTENPDDVDKLPELDDDGNAKDEEENILLAQPDGSDMAYRPDGSYTTPGSKGKFYKPDPYDKRPAGARTRSFKGTYGIETGTERTLVPGRSPLRRISRGIFEESTGMPGNGPEREILMIERERKMLIESLEKKHNEKNKESAQQEEKHDLSLSRDLERDDVAHDEK